MNINKICINDTIYDTYVVTKFVTKFVSSFVTLFFIINPLRLYKRSATKKFLPFRIINGIIKQKTGMLAHVGLGWPFQADGKCYCILNFTMRKGGLSRERGNLLMEIFSLNLTAEAKIILLYLEKYNAGTIENFEQILHKSKRQIYRYITEIKDYIQVKNFTYSLSSLSPVSGNNLNITTNQQTELRDKIGNLLDKFGKLPLLDATLDRLPEPNLKALEYILVACESRYRQHIVKKFTPYFLKCLTAMWSEAIVETQTPKETSPIQFEEEKIERPVANPQATREWENIINTTNAPASSKKLWLETAVPISYNTGILTLSVQSQMAIEKIKSLTMLTNLKFIIEQPANYQYQANS